MWYKVLGVFGVILVLYLTGILYITTDECNLPVGLVFGDYCMFGSFGLTIVFTLLAIVLGIIFTGIGNLFKSSKTDD